jgi:Leucine-rich repeat (LRR) protein
MGSSVSLKKMISIILIIFSPKDLSHNSLSSIEKSFGWLLKLLKLNLSSNMITHLIPETFNSTNIRVIDVSENQIQELPHEIGDLMHLEQLFCRQNKLKKLPKLEKCCKLKVNIFNLI